MSRNLCRFVSSILLPAALLSQQPGVPDSNSNAKFALVSFSVFRGFSLAADLKPADFVLREDGHPREITLFEGPGEAQKIPLEFVLLFDTSRRFPYQSPERWDEAIARTILPDSKTDVRLSVYHFTNGQLERLCGATRDRREIALAFGRLPDPIRTGVGNLEPMPGVQTSGWWKEATIATLKDIAASPSAARRVVFLFSDLRLSGAGETLWQDVADHALALGVPVDPVVLGSQDDAPDSGLHLLPPGSRIGEMSGGESFAPAQVDRATLAEILTRVRRSMLSRYFVGFTHAGSASPGKHTLKVELRSNAGGILIGGDRAGLIY